MHTFDEQRNPNSTCFIEMTKRIVGRRALLDRWRGIEEQEADATLPSNPMKQLRIRQKKEEWFSDAFNLLISLSKETHIWCGNWDLMGPLLETFYNYFKDTSPDSPLKVLWERISHELRQCTQCVSQYHQAQETYIAEYESDTVGPLLTVLRSLDEERVTKHLKEINARINGRGYDLELHDIEIVTVMFEVLTYPILLDDQSLVNEFQCFIEAVDNSHELALAGHQQYPGVYALLFLKSGRARSIGLRLAGCMGKLRRAADLEPLQPLLKKCIGLLETEVLPSKCDTSRPRVQIERLTIWLGIKSLLGFLEPPAFEEGILERYPIFLSIVLNHVSDDTLEFTHAINCLRLLFEKLGCKLWLKTTFSPSVMRNTLLGQCFHTRNEKSHKEIFDIFQPFLQSLEALQDGEHEKQRRHFLYFLLHQVNQSSNFSFLMRKKARQIALLIIHRGYTMNPPCPPFECSHIWGPSLVCSLKDTSLHSSLRQPSFDLIHTIIVSDASALISLKSHAPLNANVNISMENDEEDELPFFHDVEENESSCWSEFSEQSKLTSREFKDWMCIPMLWLDVLIGVDPSALPVSFSKAAFWALSRFSMVEPETNVEMELSVKDWLSSYAAQISFAFGWEVPRGSDDGGNGKESRNSVKASTICVPLMRAFKRCAAHFVTQMEQGELRKQWTWEPMMAESLILLLIEPNDNVRQTARIILEYVSKTRGLASGLQFLCSTASSFSAMYLGLRHALKLVLMDSAVSSFHNLHHLFFVVRKLLKEVTESPQKPPMNPNCESNKYKFSSEGGFLRQPVFEHSPASASGHSNIVDLESWDNFCCLLVGCLWPPMLKCLVEGKAVINNKSSLMTCVRLLEMFPVVFERLSSSAIKLSGTSDTSMPHLFDFKWLVDLVDWGKSSLLVLYRHWKQCILSLLNLLKASCHVDSVRIILDIETLISGDVVAIDDMKGQVSCLSVLLSSKNSCTAEKRIVKEEPFLGVFERKCSVKDSFSMVDKDLYILENVLPENMTENKVIILSDDETDKSASPDMVTSFGKGLSRNILDVEDVAPAPGKTLVQNANQRDPIQSVNSSKNLLKPQQLTEVDRHSGLSSREHCDNKSRKSPLSSECLSSSGLAASHIHSKVEEGKETKRGHVHDVINNSLSKGIADSAQNIPDRNVDHPEVKGVTQKQFIRATDPWEHALKLAANPLMKPALNIPIQQVVDDKRQERKYVSSVSNTFEPRDTGYSAHANLSDCYVNNKGADQACFRGTSNSDVDIEIRDTVLKELVCDKESDPWERAVKTATRQPSLLAKPVASVPKRQVIQLKMPMENKYGHLQRLGAAVRRFKRPGLDDWYRPILEIDYFSIVGLSSADKDENTTVNNTSLKEVPLCFTSPDQYVEIFRPLILEEFKAQLQNSYLEDSLTEMCCGSVCVLSVERIDDFHIIRCIPDDTESSSSRGCLDNDLVLLTKSPMQNSSQNIHMVGKVERREKDNKSRSNVLVIRFYLESSSLRSNKVKRLLTERSKWFVSRIMSITPQLREFLALSSLKDIPMLPVILNPIECACGYAEPRNVDLSMLSLSLQQVLKSSFNDCQLQAIAVAIATRVSKKAFDLSLIQGPPGTGKTRTIVAIVSGLLALGTTQKNDVLKRQYSNPGPSNTGNINSKAKHSQSTAIARAWQDAALARQLAEEEEKCMSMEISARRRVLICAQSNAAVDELVARISSGGLYGNDGKMYKPYLVRVGNAKTVHLSSLPFFIDTLVDQRLAEEKTQGVVNNDTSENCSMALRSKLEKLVDNIRSLETRRANLRGSDSCTKDCEDNGESKEGEEQEMCDEAIGAKLKVLYGKKKSIYTDLAVAQARERKASEEVKALKHKLRKTILREAEVVVATLSGCGGDIYGVCYESSSNSRFGNSAEHFLFDAVIIDEAAQALEPATLIPLQLLKSNGAKCIMVGDPKQLPATVLSNIASKFLFECSMFERLQKAGHPVIMLTEQYRMHPEICRFPSLHFYDSKLLNGNNMYRKSATFHENTYLGPYVFFDVLDGHENHGTNSGSLSLYNEAEAHAAIEVLRFFKKRYPSEFVSGRIGMVTPYKSQVSVLRSRFCSALGSDVIADMEFNTIDGFQGREVDILILSTVRASDQSSEECGFNSSKIGFVADVRRMNVALTRAKLSLWIVGNARTLQTNFNWAALLKDAQERNLVIPVSRPYEFIFRKHLSSSRENRSDSLKARKHLSSFRENHSNSLKAHSRGLKCAKRINVINEGIEETDSNSKESHGRRNEHLDHGVERCKSRHIPGRDSTLNRRHATSSSTVGAVHWKDCKPSKDFKSAKTGSFVIYDSKDQLQEIKGQKSSLVGAPHTGKGKEILDRSRCSPSVTQLEADANCRNPILDVSEGGSESSKHGKLGDLSQKKMALPTFSTEEFHQEKGANNGDVFPQDDKSEGTFATRKRQRDAVDALLSSALLSSKKHKKSSRPAPVKRSLSPTAASKGATKPPNPNKAQPIASISQVQERATTLFPHPRDRTQNTKDRSSSSSDLDEEWKSFKDLIQDPKER